MTNLLAILILIVTPLAIVIGLCAMFIDDIFRWHMLLRRK